MNHKTPVTNKCRVSGRSRQVSIQECEADSRAPIGLETNSAMLATQITQLALLRPRRIALKIIFDTTIIEVSSCCAAVSVFWDL